MSETRKVGRSTPIGTLAIVSPPRVDGGEPAAETAGDRLSVTPAAREFLRARAAVDASADVRDDRVDELRERVARGNYRPDSEMVAKRIVEEGL